MPKLMVLCAACGVGKSTVCAYLNELRILSGCACIDTDEVGVNWWNYAGSDDPARFYDDCIHAALRMAGDKHLLYVSCMNPLDFQESVHVSAEISDVEFISLSCSDEEIVRRLNARPAERMCGSDEFIAAQLRYNQWIRTNKDRFRFAVDNTELSVEKTARLIAKYAEQICAAEESA